LITVLTFPNSSFSNILIICSIRILLIKRLDKDEYDSIGLTDSLGRKQKAYVVNESGLYSILVRSDKPKAKPFRKWLTSEVIPTIRRTGGYVANEEMFIENYLPFLEEPYQNLFRLQMMAINQLTSVSARRTVGGVCGTGF